MYRKVKAKLSGVYPCTFDSESGHDFVLDGPIPDKKRIMMEIKHKCSVCGQKAYYDTFMGLFIKY